MKINKMKAFVGNFKETITIEENNKTVTKRMQTKRVVHHNPAYIPR